MARSVQYICVSFKVVIPILLVVGILNNVLVIAGFSQRSVSRSVSTRLGVFYKLIAAFDIWVLVTKDFVYYWLEDGLSLTTGGRLRLLTRTHSAIWYIPFGEHNTLLAVISE